MVGLAIVRVLTAFFSDAAMDLMPPTWRLILLSFGFIIESCLFCLRLVVSLL